MRNAPSLLAPALAATLFVLSLSHNDARAAPFTAPHGTGCTGGKVSGADFQAQTPIPTPAPSAAPASNVPALRAAKEVRVPAGVRAGLPRGARTVFCLETRLEDKPVLLHGWKRAKGDTTTLDILAITRSASRGKKQAPRSRRAAANGSTPLRRLNRVPLGEIIAGDGEVQMSIETTVLDVPGKRGVVMVLQWPYFNVSFSYSTVPMRVVTLPAGLSGRAFVQDFSTEIEPGGGTIFQPRVGSDGRFFLREKQYARDAGTARYTPYTWNGASYKAGPPGQEQPDAES